MELTPLESTDSVPKVILYTVCVVKHLAKWKTLFPPPPDSDIIAKVNKKVIAWRIAKLPISLFVCQFYLQNNKNELKN